MARRQQHTAALENHEVIIANEPVTIYKSLYLDTLAQDGGT